jgi:glycosyltransferase involved in cell wall biosynthesis
MNIALVHDWLTGMRGGEKCLEVLCRRFPQAPLLTLLHAPGSTSPAIERMQISTSFLQQIPGVSRHYRYLLPLMPRAVEKLAVPDDTQLVLSFSHAVAKSVRPPAGVPHVCYCFTPMRYAWHLREEYFRDPHTGATSRVLSGRIRRDSFSGARNLLLDRIREWDRATSPRVTHFIAISQAVARRIAECYGRSSTVIYPPVDTDFYTPAEAPREDFYLCVSALVPYKRIDLAMAACRQLRRRLVVIGQGPEQKRLKSLADDTVSFLGWQPDRVIRDYLRRCRALLFPGQEDFGIVPLEAQACGAPVIALARDGALETVVPPACSAPGTGLLFDEPHADALCQAMLDLEHDPEQVCARRARTQALKFTSERYEQEMLAYLQQRVGQTAPRRVARLAGRHQD